MLKTSIVGSIMSMAADVLIQKNVQSESGAMKRQWIYDQTIPCKIMATQNKSGSSGKDDKVFTTGPSGYSEDIHVKMQSPILLSKRWRISGIKTSDGEQLFIEQDVIGHPDTVFEIISNHPVIDPLGKISYYEVNLRRAVIQNNDTAAV